MKTGRTLYKSYQTKSSLDFMSLALNEAEKAYQADEVPVGAVIVRGERVIGAGFNQVIQNKSVCSHAEIIAINNASQNIQNYRLIGCDIYVTLEPCHMCAKAIVDARISHLYFGAVEPKTGAVQSVDNFLDREHLNHKVNYSGGHDGESAAALLKKFFRLKRS